MLKDMRVLQALECWSCMSRFLKRHGSDASAVMCDDTSALCPMCLTVLLHLHVLETLAVHHVDDTGNLHTSSRMHAQASRTTAEGLWVAVVCGAAVGVAMAAGAPLLVAVANTPPEVCWGREGSLSVVGYAQPITEQGVTEIRA